MFKIPYNEIIRSKTIQGHSDTITEIYLASWKEKQVVVKEYRTQRVYDFEIKIYSSVEHPNITALHGVSENESNPCLIIEYMSKGNLRDYIQMLNKRWEESSRLAMALGIALGLEYLHAKNILHLDLKTANILIDENHTPKIADFDTSVQLADGEDVFSASDWERGTENWQAPEIVKSYVNYTYTKACDIYSFSRILLEMYNFIDTEKAAWRNARSADEITSPAVKTLCLKSFSTTPKKRPEIGAFVKTLTRLTGKLDDSEDSDSSDDSVKSYKYHYSLRNK